MWSRLRLDISWRDLAYAGWYSIWPGDEACARAQVESFWSGDKNDSLVCQSVRSGFDLLLKALRLPAGTEVLFSAVTIPDMPRIAIAHSLVPIPVDVQNEAFELDLDCLRERISPRSRLLVVAPLFGARLDLTNVMKLAHAHSLLVVEDCAQAWNGDDWRGTPDADINLFSFGPIKLRTALGGAICRVADPELLKRMRILHSDQHRCGNWAFLRRVAKYSLLKLWSGPLGYSLLLGIGHLANRTADDLLNGLTRGFHAEGLLAQLRRRPSAANLRLLARRLRTPSRDRQAARAHRGQQLREQLKSDSDHSPSGDLTHAYWFFPIQTPEPTEMLHALRRKGFDSPGKGRMSVVQAPLEFRKYDCPVAARLLDQTVLLPCYPELPMAAVGRMGEVVRNIRHREALDS